MKVARSLRSAGCLFIAIGLFAGFLTTAITMTRAFNEAQLSSNINRELIAQGVSTSMVITACGLSFASLGLFIFIAGLILSYYEKSDPMPPL